MMSQLLLPYYEHELLFIRRMAGEFAERYPERAGALRLGATGSEDPHVERLIQAFALIAGRIQRKIHDEFPEITEALLDLLYPHYLHPIPSMAMVQFQLDPDQGTVSAGYPLAKGTMLTSPAGEGEPCRFRTCYPVQVRPLQITSGAFSRSANIAGGLPGSEAPYAIRIGIKSMGGVPLSKLKLADLRFFLAGDGQAAHTLYEILLKFVSHVFVRFTDIQSRKRSVALPPGCLVEVGFRDEEAMLPYSDRSFQGYRLLHEYFSFPQKFLLFDIQKLDTLPQDQLGDHMEIVILVNEFQRDDRVAFLEHAVSSDTFQLHCTPVINLFDRCSDPIRLTQTETEYRIVPDVHAPMACEVYSVNKVTSVVPYSEEPVEYRPFYSFRHGEEAAGQRAFWRATRRPSERNGDAGTEVFLSLVDLKFDPCLPPVEAVTVHVTCTNRDMAGRLHCSANWGELEMESGELLKVRVLQGPTKAIRPAMGGSLQWRLISHLGLNHLSIVEGGVEALRDLLALYNFGDNPGVARQILGLTDVRSRRKMARVNSEHGFVFCPGIDVEAEFDEEEFAGSGAFLLASVLERFLGLYCSVNSFSQFSVKTRQRKGVVWAWPPRSGEQIVL
jgi:type VI secretion system protein ImpG